MNIIGTEVEAGQATLYMEILPEKHMNTNQSLHGGVMASLLDTASGMSVRSLLDESETIATINLSINFLRPGFSGKLTAKGHVKSKGKKMATVEAELGVVGGNEGDTAVHKIQCTDPAKALEFCEKTGVDCLAVAIGNAHGNYPVLPELRFDVLEDIYKRTDTPLVLHGGTGITDEMFRRAISLGIRKINIATASFDALTKNAKEYTETTDKPDYFTLSPCMAEGVYENVKKHIAIFLNK